MMPSSRARLLPVVIMSLSAFALLKLGNIWFGFSPVSAQQEPAVVGAGATEIRPPIDAEAPELPAGGVERRILEQLAARRAALDLREEKMATREVVVAAAEKRLEERIAELGNERAQLLALREQRESVEAEEMDGLISAYEKMKSKDAATIFDALDEEILVPVAAGMRTQSLAGVLAEMQPENARKLTTLLAERNRIEARSVDSASVKAAREQ